MWLFKAIYRKNYILISIIIKSLSRLAGIHPPQITIFDEHVLRANLKKLTRIKKRKLKVLEIGSFIGMGSTKILAEYSEKLVCLDIWENSVDNFVRFRPWKTKSFFQRFLHNTKNLNTNLLIIKSKSKDVGEFLKDNSFDVVFIDASHRYKDISYDINLGLRLCSKKVGYLMGHDCEGSVTEGNKINFQKSKIAHIDSVKSIFPNFTHMHPGVILATSELRNVQVYGKKRISLKSNGRLHEGASSIWLKECNWKVFARQEILSI